jgi:hypothetical protein
MDPKWDISRRTKRQNPRNVKSVDEGLYGSRGYLSLRSLQITLRLSRFRFWACFAGPVCMKSYCLVHTIIAGQIELLPCLLHLGGTVLALICSAAF